MNIRTIIMYLVLLQKQNFKPLRVYGAGLRNFCIRRSNVAQFHSNGRFVDFMYTDQIQQVNKQTWMGVTDY